MLKSNKLNRFLSAALVFFSLVSLSATGLAFRNVPLDMERLEGAHLVRGLPAEASDEEYWLADGRLFVHVQEDLVKTWGPSGIYTAVLKIDRYFGSEAEVQRQMESGALPRTATLILPNFDCDDHAVGLVPEIDKVCLNGVQLGFVSGADNSWATNTFEIPLEWLRLPEKAGDIGLNELEITVDMGNDFPCWVLYQLWQAIEIDAPNPLLLVHGWTPHADALAVLQKTIGETFGLPAELAVVEMDNSPEDNARMLSEQLESLCAKYGVERFNILAHSKGGLDSRVLVDSRGLASRRVGHVLQIATPNGGSHLADIVVNPQGFWQNVLVKTVGLLPKAKVWVQDTAGVRSLMPASCAKFNLAYAAPHCPVNVVTGSLHNTRRPFQKPYVDENGVKHYNPDWGLMDWVSAWLSYDHDFEAPDDSRHGDSIISVASAHTAVPPMPDSPLVNWNLDYLHSKITDEGGPRVLEVYREAILAKGDGGVFLPDDENAGMHPVGGSAPYPKKARDGGKALPEGWREGLPFTLVEETECPALGTLEVPLPKFGGADGRAQLLLWGLPSLANAQLVLPDGGTVDLERLAADAGAAEGFAVLLAGAHAAQVEACPDGIARLCVNAKAVPKKSRLLYSWNYAGLPKLFYHFGAEDDGRFHLQAMLERELPCEVSYLAEYAPCNASLLDKASDNVAWVALPEVAASQGMLDVAVPLAPEQGYRCRLTARLRTPDGEIQTINRTEFTAGMTTKTARLEGAPALEIGSFRGEKSAFVSFTVAIPEGGDGDSYCFEGEIAKSSSPDIVLGRVSGRAVNDEGRLHFKGGVPLAQIEASLAAGDTLAFKGCRVTRWMGPLEVIVPVAAQAWPPDETLAISRPLREDELYNRPLRLKDGCLCEGGYEYGGASADGFDYLRIHLAFEDASAMPQDEEVVFHAQLLDDDGRQVAKCVAHVVNGRTRLQGMTPDLTEEADGLVFQIPADDLVYREAKPPYRLANVYVVLDGVARFRFLQGDFTVGGFKTSDFHATGTPPLPETRQFDRPIHPADLNHDGRIDADEVRAAWERWKESKLTDNLFMNAVYLEGKGKYRYDWKTLVFLPAAN